MQIDTEQFCRRLQEERVRLGLSIAAFALLGGVNRVTQARYEQGVNYPGIDYLSAIGANGVDTFFILYGRRDHQLLDVSNHEALATAAQWVEEVLLFHNYRPAAGFSGRAIIGVYRRIIQDGARKSRKPSLDDLIRMNDEVLKAEAM